MAEEKALNLTLTLTLTCPNPNPSPNPNPNQARGGAAYDAVFLSRWDVLWNRPMALPSLPGWEHRGAPPWD